MMKFSDNNNILSAIDLTSFYLNKDFYSRISFDSNFILYKTIRERLKAIKAKNILSKIKELLKYS